MQLSFKMLLTLLPDTDIVMARNFWLNIPQAALLSIQT